MEERKTKRFLITVKPSVHEKLSNLAWRKRLSLTEYINRLLEKHLEEKGVNNDKDV